MCMSPQIAARETVPQTRVSGSLCMPRQNMSGGQGLIQDSRTDAAAAAVSAYAGIAVRKRGSTDA